MLLVSLARSCPYTTSATALGSLVWSGLVWSGLSTGEKERKLEARPTCGETWTGLGLLSDWTVREGDISKAAA
jgi:hypothetical protein